MASPARTNLNGKGRPAAALFFLASLVAIVWVNVNIKIPAGAATGFIHTPAAHFIWTAALIAVSVVCIGIALNGRPSGLIIDNRNRMSLSKLQMLLWTVLVVSALSTLAGCRISYGVDAVDITIPGELLAAMGIAAASFVGAPTVLSLKAAETPTDANLSKDAAAAKKANAQLQPSGKVYGRAAASQAQWMDLFCGDEVGASASPDLSKIQQFAVTLLLVGVYTSYLVQDFQFLALPAFKGAADTFPNALPKLSTSFIGLMAISHASYLIYKAAPHTSSAPDDDSSAADGSGTPPHVNVVG